MIIFVCPDVFVSLAFTQLINSNNVPPHAYSLGILLFTVDFALMTSPHDRPSSLIMLHSMRLFFHTTLSPPSSPLHMISLTLISFLLLTRYFNLYRTSLLWKRVILPLHILRITPYPHHHILTHHLTNQLLCLFIT